MIIETYSFDYNPHLIAPYSVYPMLSKGNFIMNLQAGRDFYQGLVIGNKVFGDIGIEFYDQQNRLIQRRIRVDSSINLFFYLQDYFLLWKPKQQAFIWGEGDFNDYL